MWMMPFSKYCRTDNIYWKHFNRGSRKSHQTYQCDAQEFQSNFSGWPTNVVNVEIPTIRGKTSTRFVLAKLLLPYLCGSFCQELMLIHPYQTQQRQIYLLWNVDYQLSCPFRLVKYQMGPFSKQQKIMILKAKNSYTNCTSEYMQLSLSFGSFLILQDALTVQCKPGIYCLNYLLNV